jgi:hypothetical protein
MQVVFLSLEPNVVAGVEVGALAASLYLNVVVGAVLVLWLGMVLVIGGVDGRSD